MGFRSTGIREQPLGAALGLVLQKGSLLEHSLQPAPVLGLPTGATSRNAMEGAVDYSLTAIGTVVGLIAASVGALVAVEQLTLPARLRRLEAWARAAAEGEENDARKAVLGRIRSNATARLVSGHHVPAAYLIEGVVWTVMGFTFIYQAMTVRGAPSVWVAAISVWIPLSIGARRSLRAYLERQRIAREFAAGVDKIDPPGLDILSLMEGGTRREFVAALAYGFFVCALAVSLGLAQEPDRADIATIGIITSLLGLFGFALWLRSLGLARSV